MLGRANLPAPLSPIIGRQLELGALDLLGLAERLVTLVGVGGIGKTRLAVEVASRTVGHCEHGPFFVDLAPIGNVALRSRQRSQRRSVSTSNRAATCWPQFAGRSAAHRVVVVVDNCEHLLPGIAGLVAEVLASCPHIRVLATSREPLGIAGEHVCPVNPLQVPVSTSCRSTRSNARTSGALFLARLPMDVTIGSLSPAEVAAAAAMLPPPRRDPSGVWNSLLREPHAVASGVGEATGTLGRRVAPHRADGVPARHRTMRAALDWGFELLTPPARSALQAMSVFAGSCDLAAFTAVCADGDDPPAVDVLDELVRTSFVTVETGGERNRYRLLEPVRQHLRHLLGDAMDRERRHLEHYLALALGQTRDVDQLGLETHVEVLAPSWNFRAALDWAAETPSMLDCASWPVFMISGVTSTSKKACPDRRIAGAAVAGQLRPVPTPCTAPVSSHSRWARAIAWSTCSSKRSLQHR